MTPARAWMLGWVVALTCTPVAALAQEQAPTVEAAPPSEGMLDASGRPTEFPQGARSAGQVGSLHRVAATLESVLDIYRLALLELEPATRLVREAGEQEGALPTTPVPAPAREVYRRLANTVRNRVPESAMPPLARGYHAEVMDALGALGNAEVIAEVPKPVRLVVFAMRKVAESAHAVVDLFSRERPVEARVVDQSVIYEELGDALDEFAAAENEIRRRRKHGANQDAIAGAFRRTEIALSHLLDLWAAARQLGVDLTDPTESALLDMKVSPRISTETLQLITTRVEERAKGLEQVVTGLEARPPALAGTVVVLLEESKDGKATAHLSWPAYAPGGRPAALLRIERGDDREAIRKRLVAMFRCQGQDADAAAASAHDALADLDDAAVLVKEVPTGHVSADDILNVVPVAPPRYRITPVSPFGVAGVAAEVVAQHVPRVLEGAQGVQATLADVGYDDPKFYRRADEVTVTWELPLSDVSARPAAAAFAVEKHLPVVARYEVERIEGDSKQRVAVVGPGVSTLRDHPSAAALAKGVRYRVFTVSEQGDVGRVTAQCDLSAPVLGPVQQRLDLAAAGATRLGRPTAFEREEALRLKDGVLLGERRKRFDALPYQEQRQWLETWWSAQPESLRRQWLRDFAGLWEKERATWVRKWDGEVSSRDADWAQAALFMLDSGGELQGEVERWWTLLDRASRAQQRQAWVSSLNAGHRQWVEAQAKASEDGRRVAEEPLRLLAWWRSRESLERMRLQNWWAQLDPEARRQALLSWYQKLPAPAQESVRWPDWSRRTPAEQMALLSRGPAEMPPALWRHFFAWQGWETLSHDKRLAAVKGEVGVAGRALSAIRYGLRPLDKRLGFRGHWFLICSVVGTSIIWWSMRRLRARGRSS